MRRGPVGGGIYCGGSALQKLARWAIPVPRTDRKRIWSTRDRNPVACERFRPGRKRIPLARKRFPATDDSMPGHAWANPGRAQADSAHAQANSGRGQDRFARPRVISGQGRVFFGRASPDSACGRPFPGRPRSRIGRVRRIRVVAWPGSGDGRRISGGLRVPSIRARAESARMRGEAHRRRFAPRCPTRRQRIRVQGTPSVPAFRASQASSIAVAVSTSPAKAQL